MVEGLDSEYLDSVEFEDPNPLEAGLGRWQDAQVESEFSVRQLSQRQRDRPIALQARFIGTLLVVGPSAENKTGRNELEDTAGILRLDFG